MGGGREVLRRAPRFPDRRCAGQLGRPRSRHAVDDFSAIDRNHAALYFPRLRIPDPLQENELEDFAPCGAVAGVISRTDAARGVWKAPAGIEAKLEGVLGLSINGLEGTLTYAEAGRLNRIGINSLRAFPVIGHVIWGARTLEGADALGVGVEVRAGAPARALHRGEPLSRHAVGGLRAERRVAVGADPTERRRLHAHAVPPGRVPGVDAEGRLLREVQTARRRRRRTSTTASSTSWSASRRSSRPSSS